jgi:hypothetical protein
MSGDNSRLGLRIAINSLLTIILRKRAGPKTSMDLGDGDTWQYWELQIRRRVWKSLYGARISGAVKESNLPSTADSAKWR